MTSKKTWVDSDPSGTLLCTDCGYKTNDEEFLKTHRTQFHDEDMSMILYMDCSGSLYGRNTIVEGVSNNFIDCTGGQAAFEDGSLQEFGDEVMAVAKEHNITVYNIVRMRDPGLGLMFSYQWVDAGINAGAFQRYEIPTLDNDVEHG
jgi:hypothetical protein